MISPCCRCGSDWPAKAWLDPENEGSPARFALSSAGAVQHRVGRSPGQLAGAVEKVVNEGGHHGIAGQSGIDTSGGDAGPQQRIRDRLQGQQGQQGQQGADRACCPGQGG